MRDIILSPILLAIKPSPKVAPGKRGKTERPTSFRLSVESSKSNPAPTDEPKDRKFTKAEFITAWQEYCNLHPDQRILVAAMRGTEPEELKEGVYKVKVEHPAQKQAFEGSLMELLDFLKGKLGNDQIMLQIEISEKNEKEGQMNPKEFLKMTIEENPELAKFLKGIEAELE